MPTTEQMGPIATAPLRLLEGKPVHGNGGASDVNGKVAEGKENAYDSVPMSLVLEK